MPAAQELLRRNLAEQNNIWGSDDFVGLLEDAVKEGRELTAEEREHVDRANARIAQLEADEQRLRSLIGHGDRLAELEPSPLALESGNPTRAATAVDRVEEPDPTRDYEVAFERYLRNGMQRLSNDDQQLLSRNYSTVEQRAANIIATDSLGGYVVPPAWRDRFFDQMLAFGGMMENCEVIDTATGADMPWPTGDDTGNVGEILATENTDVTEQALAFGEKVLKSFTYSSKRVNLSLPLLQDAAFNLVDYTNRKLGERIARILNEHFTTGANAHTATPQGVVNVTVGRTTTTNAAVTYEDVVRLEHSIDPAYRNAGCKYSFNDTTLMRFRILLDADNRPLWQPSIQQGTASRFNGYEYFINQDLADIATTAVIAIFGDWKLGYVIRRVTDVSWFRFEELYMNRLQHGFLAWGRFDGMIQEASALKSLKMAT